MLVDHDCVEFVLFCCVVLVCMSIDTIILNNFKKSILICYLYNRTDNNSNKLYIYTSTSMNPEQLNQLKQADDSIPEFSLDGIKQMCKVVDVYDGDTVKVVFFTNNILHKWSVRLYGINTPELRPSRSMPNRDIEIQKARESRDFLKKELEKYDNIVCIKCLHFDKYGRLLGLLYPKLDSKDSFNQLLINNNLATVYEK